MKDFSVTTSSLELAEMVSDALRLLKRYDDALRMMVNQYCTVEGSDGDYFHNRCMSAGEYAFGLLDIKNCQRVPDDWLDDVGPHPDRKEMQNDD